MASKKKEEQRKKEEEERLAAAHKEFLDAFSDRPKLDKTWVRGGTDESERRGNVSESDTSRRKGVLNFTITRLSGPHELTLKPMAYSYNYTYTHKLQI